MRYKEEIANQVYEETDFEVKEDTLIIHVNGEIDHHNAVFYSRVSK